MAHKQEIAELLERRDSTSSSRVCGRRGYPLNRRVATCVRHNARRIGSALGNLLKIGCWSKGVQGRLADTLTSVQRDVLANQCKQAKNLRCRTQQKTRYGTIPNRLLIEDCPVIVAACSRIGDWEADTVFARTIGKLS